MNQHSTIATFTYMSIFYVTLIFVVQCLCNILLRYDTLNTFRFLVNNSTHSLTFDFFNMMGGRSAAELGYPKKCLFFGKAFRLL